MGATKNSIGDKAIKKIAETVNLILQHSDFTILKSFNKYLYHEKLIILVNTVLLQNDEKTEIIPVINKSRESVNNGFGSAVSLFTKSKSVKDEIPFIVTDNNVKNENESGDESEVEIKNRNNDICRMPDEIISMNVIENKTDIDNDIPCDENWSKTVYDLLLQLLNN